MPFGFRIETLSFKNGTAPLNVRDSDVVVFIGPNNSGKSQALRDIEQIVEHGLAGLVVQDLVSRRESTAEEVIAWLRATATIRVEGGSEWAVSSNGIAVRLDQVEFLWSRADSCVSLAPHLILRADAETRLQLAASVPSVDAVAGEAVLPLQRLLKAHAAEKDLAEAVRHAFGVGVCVNRAGGSELSLHLGETTEEPRLDNDRYLDELKALPLVATQGDGMRSFIGLMLTLSATAYPVVLIDEPEAFLHPPQARELGYQLAAESDQQRFIATHSADVLIGLLDRARSLTVVRLRRSANTTIASVLDHDRIQALWSDASLRYSNLLDGLFHAGVVICESEGDARLYAATLDDLHSSGGEPVPDVLFTPCGGKHKMPVAIGALHPLGVPVSAIADIDVLRDVGLLQRIVISLGGDWARVESDVRIVGSAIADMPVQAPTVRDVHDQIQQTLGDDPVARLSEAQTREIREITKTTDGWKLLKTNGGVQAVPPGQPAAAAERLIAELAAIGLFVVPVGTLEQWERAIGKRGLSFVDVALEARAHEQNQALRAFVTDVEIGTLREAS